MGLRDIREVIPNFPFVKSWDVFNYNKYSVDPSGLESNLIVIFFYFKNNDNSGVLKQMLLVIPTATMYYAKDSTISALHSH